MRAPGPVQFTRGRMSGAGIGFTYDEQRNTVWLLDQAVVHFAPEGDLRRRWTWPPARSGLRATIATCASSAACAWTRRPGHRRRGSHRPPVPDRDEPDRIELRGDSRITGGASMGSLRPLSARDINLDYADDGRTLQQATLAGQGVIHLAGRTARPASG